MTIRYPYLGPLGELRRLPLPTQTLEAPPNRGDAVHSNMYGGASVMRLGRAKRAWTLGYEYASPDVSDVLTGFYEGLYGEGPFVLIDPTVRNVLTLDQSSCGVRDLAGVSWDATSGAVTKSTDAAPEFAADSGVLAWASPPDGAALRPGGSDPDLTSAPAWVPGESCTASLWVRSTSGTATVQLHLTGYEPDGAEGGSVFSAATVGTAWTRLHVTTDPSDASYASAVVVLPRLLSVGASPSLHVAGGQVEYASAPSVWSRGHGAPRVLFAGTAGRSVPQIGYANHTLTLRET